MQRLGTFPCTLKVLAVLAVLTILVGVLSIFTCSSEPTLAQLPRTSQARQTQEITAQQKELLSFLAAQKKTARPRKQEQTGKSSRSLSSQKQEAGSRKKSPPKLETSAPPARKPHRAGLPVSAYPHLPPALRTLLPPATPPRALGDFKLGMTKAAAVKIFLDWFREGKIKPTIWSGDVFDFMFSITVTGSSSVDITPAGRIFPVPYDGVSGIACQFTDSSWIPNDPKDAERLIKSAHGAAQRGPYLCELCARLMPVADLRAGEEIPRYFTEKICRRKPDLVKTKSAQQAMAETVWINDYFAEWAHVPDDAVRRRYTWHWPSHQINLALTVYTSPQKGEVYSEIYLWQKAVQRLSVPGALTDYLRKKMQ